MLTESEHLFESLCKTKGIGYYRIQEGKSKTPDYEIIIGSTRVVLEVKQLDENEKDRELNEALDRGDEITGIECPSNRLRRQIAKAYKQLKAYHRTGIATGIVLYNNAGLLNFIDTWTVTKAMFGNYGYKFGMPANSSSPIVGLGTGFMGRRKLTRNSCRFLSFVSILKKGSGNVPLLEVYHNPFCKVLITPTEISSIASSQFMHKNPYNGNWIHWEPDLLDV